MAMHTGETSGLECNKCFNVASKLIKHMTIHTGERPHVCPQCNKSFTRSDYLNKHLMIHTGENAGTIKYLVSHRRPTLI